MIWKHHLGVMVNAHQSTGHSMKEFMDLVGKSGLFEECQANKKREIKLDQKPIKKNGSN